MAKALPTNAPQPFVWANALKEAGFAALVTAGLAFPILALRTESDVSNKLILTQRWSWVLWAAALVFIGRLAILVYNSRPTTAMSRMHAWLLTLAWLTIPLVIAGLFAVVAAIYGSPNTAVGLAFFFASGLIWVYLGQLILEAEDKDQIGKVSAAAPQSDTSKFVAKWIGTIGLIVLFIFPFVTVHFLGASGALKWINNYGVQILIYIMLGWGLNIVVGLAGLLDLGYVAFYAVGAYSYALLSTTYGLSFWICLPLAGILAATWGIILGFPVLRLRGDYLAIVTLAFGEIIRIILINWTDFSNGYAGISSIPKVTFFGLPFTDGESSFSSFFGLEYSPIHRTMFLFYLILCLALLTNVVTMRLRRLPVGRAWEALREDEIACRSLGINTTSTKLTAFALGAMFAGFAGSFFAVRQGFVSPESFTFLESASVLAIVVLGGMGSQIGVAIAAIVLVGGTELLRELEWTKQIFGQDFDPAQYRSLIFGAAMVIMMIWKPRGIVSTREPSLFLKEKKSVSGSLVGEGHG